MYNVENLNFLFHGMLLDPLIEDSCGPLINCDSCSTFDETLCAKLGRCAKLNAG